MANNKLKYVIWVHIYYMSFKDYIYLVQESLFR